MTRILTIAALLCLASCAEEDSGPAPSNDAASAAQAPATEKPVPTLDGQWQIAAIDGKPVSAASAMTASFESGKAIIAAGCLRRAWTFTQERNVVAFVANPGGSTNCGGGASGEQETAYAALEGASIAIFSKDGAEASLSGTGGNLTLRRR